MGQIYNNIDEHGSDAESLSPTNTIPILGLLLYVRVSETTKLSARA